MPTLPTFWDVQWQPGTALANKHWIYPLVKQGAIGEPDLDYFGLDHVGSLSPEHWYQVNVFWWWLAFLTHRFEYWDMKHHDGDKPYHTAWYLVPILYLLHRFAFLMPRPPEKGSYFKALIVEYNNNRRKHKEYQVKLATNLQTKVTSHPQDRDRRMT